ncbi:hypothetical protein PR202_gb12736 [Eleusine coracana subsp. coracana]|uniref:Uncharacterized protein n=1 Tax=Eleusine coracana subsp. coracana TaxID=191504 RepID=A0AAV5ER91_ELECO|nr:hypothetical protein PR202_gb12736 [Eleusine coracana subsp. coracana]
MHNEFGANPAKCFMRRVQMFDSTPIGKMPEATKSVTDLGKWACVWVTVAWGFLFRVFFYIALLLGNKNKRT